jgi:hypothetical protein
VRFTPAVGVGVARRDRGRDDSRDRDRRALGVEGEVSLDEDGASIPRDDVGVGEEVGQTVGEEVGEEVGELADGRTIRFFSWVTQGDEWGDEPGDET